MRVLLGLILLVGQLGGCDDEPKLSSGLPVAKLEAAASAITGTRVELDASKSYDPGGGRLRYRFEFADGKPAVITGSATSRHVFERPGTYSVCVYVAVDPRFETSACRSITVLAAPTPDAAPDARIDVSRDAPSDRPGDLRRDTTIDARRDLALDSRRDGHADLRRDVALDARRDLHADQRRDAAGDFRRDTRREAALPDSRPCFAGGLTGGTGAAGYSMLAVPACGLSLATTGTKLGVSQDESGMVSLLPFTFYFWGKPSLAVGVSSNGYLQLVGSSPLTLQRPMSQAIPTADDPNNLIAAFWDNLMPSSTDTDVLVATYGTAPYRVHVIQWQGWTFPGQLSTAEVTFSIFLYETSNVIEIHYLKLNGSARAGGASATVGIENETGTEGLQHLFHKPGLMTQTGVRFVPK